MLPSPEESYQISKRQHKEIINQAAKSRQIHELRKQRKQGVTIPLFMAGTFFSLIALLLYVLGLGL